MLNEEQTARPNLRLLPTPAPPSPWPPHSCSLRQGEGTGVCGLPGGKQTGCLGPSPDSSPGLPGMAITGPLLAAPRAIKAGELGEPSAKRR